MKFISLLKATTFFLCIISANNNVLAQVIDKMVPVTKTLYGTPAPGYLFITPLPLDTANYPAALAMLDEQGNPVFYKPFAANQTPPYLPVMVTDFKLQPSGLMSYGIQKAPGNMIIYLMDSSFMVVDSISNVNDVDTDAHDFIHQPDGTYHLVGTEERVMDCSSILTANGLPGAVNATVVGNVIQRFSPDKTLVFEWRSLDYFNLDDVYSQYYNNPNYLDHSHYNALEIDFDGNYLLSFRHLNEITKVNSVTGDILWRLGGKSGMFTFVGDTMPFTAQHDARRIANGNLTLFDNGLFNSTPGARALEYALDETNYTATVVWSYNEPSGLPSVFIGSARRQANGNTLIDWGGAFPLSQSVTITEVDAQGNGVMELDFADDLFVTYRAIKQVLPFGVVRPEIDCNQQLKTLSAPHGYTNYEWNTGAKTQSIVIDDTGSYQVWVNQGIGYVCSHPFYVNDIENFCQQQAILPPAKTHFVVYPNPTAKSVFIKHPIPTEITAVKIYNQQGRTVLNAGRPASGIDVSALEPGLYFIEVLSGEQSALQKLIISN